MVRQCLPELMPKKQQELKEEQEAEESDESDQESDDSDKGSSFTNYVRKVPLFVNCLLHVL
jgi:hypothetical protein